MKKSPEENSLQLGELYSINKIPWNQPLELNLGNEQGWISDLLYELNENSNLKKEEGHLHVDLGLVRKNHNHYRELVTVEGHVEAEFHTQCVRCLHEMPDNVEFYFKSCFISESFKEDEGVKEEVTFLCDNDEMDLYFYCPKKNINLKDLLHEQIFININPFPLHDKNCKGLCHSCGHNLNEGDCQHSKK